jgi:mannose-6-phosphate isomerase-like protein (cupin superfamily)
MSTSDSSNSAALHLRAAELLRQLPLPATAKWPDGVFDIEAFARSGLTLELFAPRGADHQSLHSQDELYIVVAGNAVLDIDGVEHDCEIGDALFAPARVPHRFVRFSGDFAAWVVFWGASVD